LPKPYVHDPTVAGKEKPQPIAVSSRLNRRLTAHGRTRPDSADLRLLCHLTKKTITGH
jgi:hypothetical protein